MNKISLNLVVLLFFIANISNSQTILLSENFNTWPPTSMTIESGPTSTANGDGLWHQNYGEAYVRYVDDDMIHDERLITNTISLPSNVGDLIKVKWFWYGAYFDYFVNNHDAYNPDYNYDPNFNVLITTDNGVTWDTLWQEDDSISVINSGVEWPWQDEQEYYSEMDISQYAGEDVKIKWQFEGQQPVLYWIIDNVSVFTQAPIDLELKELTTPVYSLPESVNITGLIVNDGTQEITSFDVNYNIDGGTESAVYSVTGLHLELDNTAYFTHNVPFNFTDEGTHAINVKISNVNGGGETLLGNNELSKPITIDQNYTPKRTLFEDFTGSTCAACAYANEHTFNAFFENLDVEKYTLIKYPMDYPGDGDPYYTAECGTRAGFYNIYGIPHFRMDGMLVPHAGIVSGGPDTLKRYYKNNIEYNATMSITSTYTLDQTSKNINVEVKVDSKIDYSNINLFVAVVEKETTQNVGDNGETVFKQVFMKMLPNANGESINLTAHQESTFSFSADLSSIHAEEFTDLEVIVFAQEPYSTSGNDALQSTISVLESGSNINSVDYNSIKIYPNPTKDVVTICNAKNSEVEIYNMLSQLVISEKMNSISQTIDVSKLENGTYFIKVIDAKGNAFTNKIVISK